MSDHPLKTSVPAVIISLLLALSAAGCYTGLLWFYEDITWKEVIIEPVCFVGVWYIVYYFSWYFIHLVQVWQAWVVVSLVREAILFATCYSVLSIFGITFLNHIPILIPMSLMAWIILSQFYVSSPKGVEENTAAIPVSGPSEPTEKLDKISVKNGTRIHIIPIGEILYIQAAGDYVTLITADNQYVKELTMKYLESHLPSTFVRIHRSCIINAESILRIELFGKESYHVRLKNGQTLKASVTGYKMLKERLQL